MKIKAKNKIVTVERFDPLKATEEDWAKFYSFRKQRHAKENPNDPLSSDDSFKAAITANVQYPEAEIYIYAIIDTKTNKQIGDVDQASIREISPSYEAAKHLLQFSIYLLPEYRRQGIGSEILKMVIDEATKREKVLLMTGSDTEDGKAFLKAIGAKT
ncbi:MAG: GNAT family N-acetyltransferase [Candidatus Heimdallarchaeota archaeon]